MRGTMPATMSGSEKLSARSERLASSLLDGLGQKDTAPREVDEPRERAVLGRFYARSGQGTVPAVAAAPRDASGEAGAATQARPVGRERESPLSVDASARRFTLSVAGSIASVILAVGALVAVGTVVEARAIGWSWIVVLAALANASVTGALRLRRLLLDANSRGHVAEPDRR